MKNPYIRLASGFCLDLDTFDLSRLSIRDLAYGLAVERRFSGRGMNVAAHSVLVLQRVEELLPPGEWQNERRWALLHDASEGLGLRDIASPFKQLPELDGYRQLEAEMMSAVTVRFDLLGVRPDVVRQADWETGRTEQIEIWGPRRADDKWAGVEPLPYLLPRWDEHESRIRFEDAADRLGLR